MATNPFCQSDVTAAPVPLAASMLGVALICTSASLDSSSVDCPSATNVMRDASMIAIMAPAEAEQIAGSRHSRRLRASIRGMRHARRGEAQPRSPGSTQRPRARGAHRWRRTARAVCGRPFPCRLLTYRSSSQGSGRRSTTQDSRRRRPRSSDPSACGRSSARACPERRARIAGPRGVCSRIRVSETQ